MLERRFQFYFIFLKLRALHFEKNTEKILMKTCVVFSFFFLHFFFVCKMPITFLFSMNVVE